MTRLLRRFVAVLVACTVVSFAADLPIRQVTLYKHGIGYFEREGVASAARNLQLTVQNDDMNDVLKSLTVESSGNGAVQVRYASNETPEQRLSHFPFQVGQGEPVANFLDGMKGAGVVLTVSGKPVTGRIVSARVFASATSTPREEQREEVTVLLDSGDIASYDLAQVSAWRLTDPDLAAQFSSYLQTVAQTRSKDKRSVELSLSGAASQPVRVSYISPAAIWKSSYRLTLSAREPRLEGWAIVDNTSGEDWNDVRLSVVSGRPISFISPLDTPHYGNRQIADLREDGAAGPVVYSGSVDAQEQMSPGAVGGVLGGVAGAVGPAPPPPPVPAAKQSFTAARSVQTATTGAAVGELVEYKFAQPITIKRDQSAMLPFFADRVGARKLLIYTREDGEHPVNAAELQNTTGNVLDGGPITIYDGGAYGGESLVETLKAGDKRLIGYAVDFGTRVTTNFGSGEQFVREVHVRNGNLEITFGQQQTRTYTIRNVDPKPKTLIIQQPSAGMDLVSPKPLERTADAYRFEVKLPANGSETLQVQQEQTLSQTEVVTTATPDFLLTLVENKRVPASARTQLSSIAQLKSQAAALEAKIKATQKEHDDLTNDENRIRQNIGSLNRVAGQEKQVQDYSVELAEAEIQISKVRDTLHATEQQKAALDQSLRDAITALQF